jgi:hypothetical protein
MGQAQESQSPGFFGEELPNKAHQNLTTTGTVHDNFL